MLRSLLLITYLLINLNLAFSQSVNTTFEREIVLTDSLAEIYRSPQSKFHLLDNVLYMSIDSPPSIAAYDINSGKQLDYIAFEGRGPNELETLYDFTVSDSLLFLLDYTGKILKMQRTPFKVLESSTYETMRTKLIHGFNNQLYVVNESPAEDYSIEVLNTNLDRLSLKAFDKSIPQRTENILLSAFSDAAHIITKDNKLIYAPSFGNMIYTYANNTLDSVDLAIPDFKVGSVDDTPLGSFYTDMSLMQKFFSNNSIITGIYSTNGNYLVEVSHLHDNYSRAIALFDKDFNYLCYSMMKDQSRYDGTKSPKIQFSDKDHIYYYREEFNDSSKRTDKILAVFSVICK